MAKTRQCLRQFAARARISIENGFLSVRVKDENESTRLGKVKMMSVLWVFFSFSSSFKKTMSFLIIMTIF